MKIIKHGKYFDDGKPIHGNCVCGCEVEVLKKEIGTFIEKKYDYRNESYTETIYFVKCPECNFFIRFENVLIV